MQMVQIELEQSEEYIKHLKEQPEQDQLRIDNKVCASVLASFKSISHQQAVAAVLTLQRMHELYTAFHSSCLCDPHPCCGL